MNNFPVKKLKADIIELGGQPLVNENGNLVYNGELIANYEDLIEVHIVPSEIDMNLLAPKYGDIVKRTDQGQSYIWNGVWNAISKEKMNVYTVSSQLDLDLLSPFAGDMANLTSTYQSLLYDGSAWNAILTGIVGNIDDAVTGVGSTWSSSKIDYLVKNHDHDGGVYN